MVLLKLIQINPGAQLDQIIDKLDLLATQIESKLIESKLAEQATADLKPVQTNITPEAAPPLPTQTHLTGNTPVQRSLETEEVPKTWPNFLKEIEKKLPVMFALLSKGVVNESTPGTIQVQLHNCSAFDKSRISTKKQELHSQCKSFLGKNLTIAIMSENSLPDKPDKQMANMKMMAQNHPLVMDAQRIFDGKIIN